MDLTRHTLVSADTVQSIMQRHRLGARGYSKQPWVGGDSRVYQLGDDLVLKVLRENSRSAHVEAIAAHAARAAGVRTPRLIAFDDTLDLLPVPYLVYERVQGEPLSGLGLPSGAVGRVWHEVGRDLAVAHTRVLASESLHVLPTYEETLDIDPRPWVDDLHDAGDLTAAQARWLSNVLKRLALTVLAPHDKRFCHGDVNAANVMVGTLEPRGYVALLDWAGAGWADPAGDFRSMPLSAVPFALAGYREVAPMDDDDTAEARILWSYIQLALFLLNRNALTGPERAQRIARLVTDTRWFLERVRLP